MHETNCGAVGSTDTGRADKRDEKFKLVPEAFILRPEKNLRDHQGQESNPLFNALERPENGF